MNICFAYYSYGEIHAESAVLVLSGAYLSSPPVIEVLQYIKL
jgi:hypothetical protein